MFAASAPSPPTLSTNTSEASPTSPSRSGRLRGLSYLRSYTHNHLHPSLSHSSPSSQPSSSRPAVARTRSTPVGDGTGARIGSRTGRRTAATAANRSDSPSRTSGWLPTTAGRSGPSRLASRTASADTSSAERATPSSRSMTRNRSETVAPSLTVRSPTMPASNAATAGSEEPPDVSVAKPQIPSIQLVPHHDPRSPRPSLVFPVISRTLPTPDSIIRVGRYSERDTAPEIAPSVPSSAPVGFKSKVVSRRHCEFWCENGQWYIKDVKSSSGTFLNHIRLSSPNVESKPYAVNDGDVVQLGIDFKGGEEMIFRCVKIRLECNRGWQRALNNFNKATHKRLKNLTATKKDSDAASVHSSECSICLLRIAPCQALFVAPCSHVWHYKCIRPILQGKNSTWPNFLCPNCRAVANLEADVDEPEESDWEGEADAAVAKALEESKHEAEQLGLTNGASTDDSSLAGKRKTLLALSASTASDDSNTPRGSGTPVIASSSGQTPAPAVRSTNGSPKVGDSTLAARLGVSSLSVANDTPTSTNAATIVSPSSTTAPIQIAAPAPVTPAPVATRLVSSSSDSEHSADHSEESDREIRSQFAERNLLTPDPPEVGGPECPMTPRNDAGPFILDGSGSIGGESGGRVRRSLVASSLDDRVDGDSEREEGAGGVRVETPTVEGAPGIAL